MDAGQYVTVDHVKKTIAKSSLKDRGILPGDVVLINTGWSDNYADPDEKGLLFDGSRGIFIILLNIYPQSKLLVSV